MRIILIILLSFLFLSGCTTYSARVQQPVAPTLNEDSISAGLPLMPDSMRQGMSIQVSDPAFAAPFETRVGQSYRSALGNTCFRLTPVPALTHYETVALCQGTDGAWSVAPRIFSRQMLTGR